MKCPKCRNTDIDYLELNDMQYGKPRRSIRWWLHFFPDEKRISNSIKTIAEFRRTTFVLYSSSFSFFLSNGRSPNSLLWPVRVRLPRVCSHLSLSSIQLSPSICCHAFDKFLF